MVNENSGEYKVTISLSDSCIPNQDIRVDFHTEEHTASSSDFESKLDLALNRMILFIVFIKRPFELCYNFKRTNEQRNRNKNL